ncbi:hypothetical protein HMPREF1862_01777 [Varibaculum cambriense]|uniref:Uncharacterized protein n=1 Tax=Varibaculum cambriense TaxID=184870 RepID=A0AB34WXW6_9ACTO|nr:hypothetical protein HMPREF1862_01777 [Varibaculum cambriense]
MGRALGIGKTPSPLDLNEDGVWRVRRDWLQTLPMHQLSWRNGLKPLSKYKQNK